MTPNRATLVPDQPHPWVPVDPTRSSDHAFHVRGQRVRPTPMTQGWTGVSAIPGSWRTVARLKIAHAILDAECCCCDGDNGVTDFDRLMAGGHDASAYAYAFDLLAIDDRDVRSEPLEQRKAALAKLLRKAKPGIRLSEHLTGSGQTIFEELRGLVNNPLEPRRARAV